MCYQIIKNGNEIEVHCKCCRDYGKPKIMIASAQNIVSNMQQHGGSLPHQEACKKSTISTDNMKATKQTSRP